MSARSTLSRRQGSLSESRFQEYLQRQGVPFQAVVGTTKGANGKVDFIVNGKRVQVKAPSGSGLALDDLTIEHRAVDGSLGWLYCNDYLVKFISDNYYMVIECSKLRDAVQQLLPPPPEIAPRGKAIVHGGWYARNDWHGRDRSKECCYVVSAEWLYRHCSPILKEIR